MPRIINAMAISDVAIAETPIKKEIFAEMEWVWLIFWEPLITV